jgi:RHS repeat-associated protein
VDPATNRITNGGVSYDATGNMTAMPGLTMSYDTDNRMYSNSSGETYTYDASGLRAAKTNGTPLEYYFYGVDGSLLQRWTGGYNVYFGSKLIYNGNGTTVTDRLGSVVEKDPYTTTSYFPYGDEPSATDQNRPKFATYYRDSSTALDYAQQRCYSSTLARFTSPDPYGGSAHLADPQTWNRYGYVQNDPVSSNDPSGLGPVTLPPVVPGVNCSSAFINYAADFGETIQQLFDSDQGILTMMSYFEQQGSGSSADKAVWAALDWTFLNRALRENS